jgi:bis(5'-nucleosyl)-tetraphosphatase (symmetrical)
MATYFVGDVQGCNDELQQLLAIAQFDPKQDELWLTGDLVARGPKSLDVLRFVYGLGDRATTVLGNHDLNLLAVAAGHAQPKKKDKTENILTAPDREELMNWLRTRPIMAEHPTLPVMMTHAGLSPQWDLNTARQCAREIEMLLSSDQGNWLLGHMYGEEPSHWDHRLTGLPRWRYIINSFTRMRFCRPDGSLEFKCKASPSDKPEQLAPWFEVRKATADEPHLVFGHWAALMGKCPLPSVKALDTGCVWGNQLTLWRWNDNAMFSLNCPAYASGGE